MKYTTEELRNRDAEGMARLYANGQIDYMVKDMKNDISSYRKSMRSQEKVLNKVFTFHPEIAMTADIDLSRYGTLTISGISDKSMFADIQLNLIERFGEPKKDQFGSDKVQFLWSIELNENGEYCQWYERVHLRLVASPEVNGCILVTEEVEVPEKVETIPAHTETRYIVKCE